MWRHALWVAISSGAGGALRYLAGRWLSAHYPGPFPLHTFLVNITGCLIMGAVSGLSSRHGTITPETALVLTSGFCGGFTTFSAFAWENVQLLRSDSPLLAWAYIFASIVLGLTAAWAGMQLSKLI